MNWKKIGKAVLFPPMLLLLLLFPISIGIMLYGMFHFGENHPITIATYFIIVMAIYMIVQSSKKLKKLRTSEVI